MIPVAGRATLSIVHDKAGKRIGGINYYDTYTWYKDGQKMEKTVNESWHDVDRMCEAVTKFLYLHSHSIVCFHIVEKSEQNYIIHYVTRMS